MPCSENNVFSFRKYSSFDLKNRLAIAIKKICCLLHLICGVQLNKRYLIN
ncbi:hypothetical protein SLEP1_g51867 [Rubroshorea leprosula]|uniref:Uncharacterized protein n=1 Tax=Rubroshorea leprosula TaxID=152421 RepID=A0AAV5M4J0_9ROSI|nr:hypothetical protein SLEP1_g51867 [Rubroshorea leprosula]